MRELGSAYRQSQRLGRCARAPGAAEKGGNAQAEVANQWTRSCMAREVAGVLSLKLSQGRARPPRTGWSYSVVAASVPPDQPARICVSRTPATVSSTTTAAALQPRTTSTCPPTSQSAPATRWRTCDRRTPRPPNGVEQQPGRSPVPTAPSSARVVVRGAYPLRRCAITSWSSSKTTQRTSALPQSLGMQGVPPVSLGRRGAIACARLNAASDLGSPARLRPKGADRARPQ